MDESLFSQEEKAGLERQRMKKLGLREIESVRAAPSVWFEHMLFDTRGSEQVSWGSWVFVVLHQPLTSPHLLSFSITPLLLLPLPNILHHQPHILHLHISFPDISLYREHLNKMYGLAVNHTSSICSRRGDHQWLNSGSFDMHEKRTSCLVDLVLLHDFLLRRLCVESMCLNMLFNPS